MDIKRSAYGEFITATAPVHVWETEFDTEFHLFTHTEHKHAVIRAHSYSLPQHLHPHVFAVYNTVELPFRRQSEMKFEVIREEVTSANAADSKTIPRKLITNYLTPTTLRAYYNVSVGQTGSGSVSQSVMESDQFYSPSDLSKFQTANGLTVSPVYRNYGGHASDQACYGR